ncbi:MAG TPA: AI-2E family transporter [Longimicrobiaceae bacterium]|nr:AI-2E family transporter [Longimicrobiaceae bacterium]
MDERTPRDESVLTPDVDPQASATPVDAAAPTPDLERTEAAVASPRARSVGITTLTVLALLYTVYFARPFLLPLAFALLLNFLFSPLVRALTRFRIRPPLGAALVVLGLLGALGVGVYELSGPVQVWVEKAPETMSDAQRKIRKLMRPIERASRQLETATAGAAPPAQQVVVRPPSTVSRIAGLTRHFFAAALEVVILLYFLLAAGDLFLQKLIKVLPTREEKQQAVEIARETESSISTYLLTAASLNLAEGILVSGAMYLLGMPNPLLWGAMVALLEFIPYLGAVTIVAVLGVAAITTFDNVGHALLVPGSFLAINLVQANLVTPLLLGHRLALNPVAILVGLAFWFWVWGVPGAFIAVPLLATFKIFCDHIQSLAAVGEFLGMRDDDERRAAVRGV